MKIKQFIYLATALLVFGACSEDLNTGQPSAGENVTVGVSLQPSGMQQVELSGDPLSSALTVTRSVTALTDDAEKVINNLWVFEYVGGTYVRGQYLSTVDATKLNLDLSTATNANIYFVANVGQAAYKGKTLATEIDFQNYSLSITDEASITPSAGYLPMFGAVTSVAVPGYFTSGATVTMDYLVSRVDLTYTVTDNMSTGFVLKRSRLINVPVSMYPYIDSAISDATHFPADGLTTKNFDREDIASSKATGGTLTFYLPDNRRGEGSNTAGSDAKLKAGIDDATAIQLIGYKDGDEIIYNFYLGGDEFNDYNLKRNTKYTLTADLDGTSTGDLRVTKTETSNTYMVKPGKTVMIPVKRANQSDLGEQLPDLSMGWTPGVLWRDNSSLTITATDAGNGIMEVTASDATATGNALVYIKDASDNILWSWQIWVTDYDPASENETYNNYTFMDRNLGAVNDTKGSLGSFGLLYQWGRKDPFRGSSSTTLDNKTLRNFYSGGSGTGLYSDYYAKAPVNVANNLENSVRNPHIFYIDSDGTRSADWYCGSNLSHNVVLWGTTKTVYDPCPTGWKVPPTDAFSSWTTSYAWNNSYKGRSVLGITDSWYPATGARNWKTANLGSVSVMGYYQTSQLSSLGFLNFSPTTIYQPQLSGGRADGFTIRCVQE